MITRIVKLHIRPEMLDEFVSIYLQSSKTIRSFKGCKHVEVFQHTAQQEIVFTYSKWDSEEDLNAYRESPFFIGVWNSVKPLFLHKAEAWSLISFNENE